MVDGKVVCGGCCVCWFVVVIILILCSFSTLEYVELGLNYSWVAQTVEDKTYPSGRYFLGLGHSFIKFPATVQTIEFSDANDAAGPMVRSRTSDGLEVQLEISLQYQLLPTKVSDLYQKFGTDYHTIFVRMATDDITCKATAFDAGTFFTNRTTISVAMEQELVSSFGTQAYSSVPFFQLRSVSLPHDFEQAIQTTEVKKQDIQTAQAEMQNKEVDMMTQVLQAQQQALAIGFSAEAQAQTTILNAEAYCTQFRLTQELQAKSFAPIYEQLGKNATLLAEYMQTRALRDHPDHLSVVGMPAWSV